MSKWIKTTENKKKSKITTKILKEDMGNKGLYLCVDPFIYGENILNSTLLWKIKVTRRRHSKRDDK